MFLSFLLIVPSIVVLVTTAQDQDQDSTLMTNSTTKLFQQQVTACSVKNCNSNLISDEVTLDKCTGLSGILKTDEIVNFCITVKNSAAQKAACGDKCYCQGDYTLNSCTVTALSNNRCQVKAKYTYAGICELKQPAVVDLPPMDPPNICLPRKMCGYNDISTHRFDGSCESNPNKCQDIYNDSLKLATNKATETYCTNMCECKGDNQFDCNFADVVFPDGKTYCMYHSKLSLQGVCAKGAPPNDVTVGVSNVSMVDDTL